MSKVRRLLAVCAFLGVAAVVSTSLQGQSGKKAAGTTPQLSAVKAAPVTQLADAPAESRFTSPGVQTYQPVKGDGYFALRLQPTLEATPARERDILIMLSTSGTQAGPGWVAAHQIAEGIIQRITEQAGREFDRVSLWTANEPKFTVNLTKDFLAPKDFAQGKRLRDVLAKYKAKEVPAGATDLKNALTEAIKTFDSSKERQRIFLFLGDGLSTFNPISDAERLAIAKTMVKNRIAFFAVPLGFNLDPTNLHGLANSTGGTVLRTDVQAEKVVDALKRYETAFAAPILYNAALQLPAGSTDVCPSVLPPLRTDSPTLLVGRMKNVPKQLDCTLTGNVDGKKTAVTIKTAETVLAPNLDNYFLVGLIDQWTKAKEYPAILRADRSLAIAYEQTRLQHMECLENAELALTENKLVAAGRLFKQAKTLAPHDNQADAGINIVKRLEDGTLDKDKIRKELKNRKGQAAKLEVVNGKPQWVKVDLVKLEQDEAKPAADKKLPPIDAKQPLIAPENLLKEARERQAVEEQKVNGAVQEAIRQARLTLRADPDGTLDMLKNLLNRVKDHPDLGGQIRDGLAAQLQTALRTSATDVKLIKMKKEEVIQAAAVAQQHLLRDQERKSFEDRVDSQFRVFKTLMTRARYEERTKTEIMQAMVAMQDEARSKGFAVPTSSKAMYDIALAALPLQTHNTLVRQREAGWLTLMMGIEKSHVPFPDEPFIHFPPLATWKALTRYRKDRYEVTSMPDDDIGRNKANEIKRLLDTTIETKGLQEKVKLKTALEYFTDKFDGKLPILVDDEAFKDGQAEAPSLYEEEVSLPPVPKKMPVALALRLILSQVGKGKATYMIRREYVEITTDERYIADKVIRIYPVGDLVTPIPGLMQGQLMGGLPGGMGGGMPGMMGGGMPGMMMGGMPGMMGGGMPGMMMGGMPGMMGGGMPGMMMGGGMPGMMGGGMPGMMGGGMPGMMMGGMPGMMGGGMPGMMMGGMPGMMGGGGMMMGGGGMMMGGAMIGGGQQGQGLINLVTAIVDPGNWNQPVQLTPFMMMGGFPMFMGGFMGFMGGLPGAMMGGAAIGAGPPANPNLNVDPQTSNSIGYFPPALALIVRAPSRVHTSITGGIVGGKTKRGELAAGLQIEKDGLAKFEKDNPNIKVVKADFEKFQKQQLANREKFDAEKVWNEAFDKGGIDPGLVVATADFLFEAGQFKHAAEFLKANLRHGNVVRPWVFEALAVALESSGGDPDEIQRVRLSGIALDPQDSQGYLSAARAMADRGHYARAVAFCKQASQLEPNDYHPYEIALAYAESSKDAPAMQWAVGKLAAQDWPVDNLFIQKTARQRLNALATALKAEKRFSEATTLEEALARLNRRDLRVKLSWDNGNGPCEVEMKIKEPAGSICTLEQKQTPGGGIMIGCNLTDPAPSAEYIVAEAFPGEYEVSITRLYGDPLNNRARLEITANAGTAKQTRRVEIVVLDKNNASTFKVKLNEGRRTEAASVSLAAQKPHNRIGADGKEINAFNELRQLANPSFYGAGASAGPRGSAGTPGQIPTVASLAAKDSKSKTTTAAPMPILQNAVSPNGSGVPMTTQMRLNPDSRNYDMVIRPFFASINAAQTRPAVNLPGIPGGN